jgi:hypothetical protein
MENDEVRTIKQDPIAPSCELTIAEIRKSSYEVILRQKPDEQRWSDEELGSILSVLEECESFISVLSLENSILFDDALVPLLTSLCSETCVLQALTLKGTKLKDSDVLLLSKQLGSSACKLTVLDLHDCGVSLLGVEAISRSLTSTMCGLRRLDLSNNNIDEVGAKMLADSIMQNNSRTLQHLSLSGSRISHEATSIFISTLSSLDLSYCNMDDEVGVILANALKEESCTLKLLKLHYNRLEDKSAKALGEALRVVQTLLSLNLEGNQFTTQGINYINEGFFLSKSPLNTYGGFGDIKDVYAILAQASRENIDLVFLRLDRMKNAPKEYYSLVNEWKRIGTVVDVPKNVVDRGKYAIQNYLREIEKGVDNTKRLVISLVGKSEKALQVVSYAPHPLNSFEIR